MNPSAPVQPLSNPLQDQITSLQTLLKPQTSYCTDMNLMGLPFEYAVDTGYLQEALSKCDKEAWIFINADGRHPGGWAESSVLGLWSTLKAASDFYPIGCASADTRCITVDGLMVAAQGGVRLQAFRDPRTARVRDPPRTGRDRGQTQKPEWSLAEGDHSRSFP